MGQGTGRMAQLRRADIRKPQGWEQNLVPRPRPALPNLPSLAPSWKAES